MADKCAKLKVIYGVGINLMDSLNKVYLERNPQYHDERRNSSSARRSNGTTRKGSFYIYLKGSTPGIKELLKEWLPSTLNDLVDNLPQRGVRRMPAMDLTAMEDEPEVVRANSVLADSQTSNDALTAILRKMEEMEQENKSLRDQMKEHQEKWTRSRALLSYYQSAT